MGSPLPGTGEITALRGMGPMKSHHPYHRLRQRAVALPLHICLQMKRVARAPERCKPCAGPLSEAPALSSAFADGRMPRSASLALLWTHYVAGQAVDRRVHGPVLHAPFYLRNRFCAWIQIHRQRADPPGRSPSPRAGFPGSSGGSPTRSAANQSSRVAAIIAAATFFPLFELMTKTANPAPRRAKHQS